MRFYWKSQIEDGSFTDKAKRDTLLRKRVKRDALLTPGLYPEAKTARLGAHFRRRHSCLPFTWLPELELTNSLQLKVFRGEGTEAAVAATLAAVRADMEAGAFFRAQIASTGELQTVNAKRLNPQVD